MVDLGGEVEGKRMSNKNMLSNQSSVCSSCFLRDGQRVKADNYCIKCETAFCSACLKNHETLLPNHPIRYVGYSDMSMAVGGVASQPTDICEDHLKLIDLFCKKDDVAGCATCMAINHGSCNVVYIPKSVHHLLQPTEIEHLTSNVTVTLEKIEAIQVEQKDTLAELEGDREYCIHAIKNHRTELIALLDGIVRTSCDRVEDRFKELRTSLLEHRQMAQESVHELKAAEERIIKNIDNGAQLFLEMKKCKSLLSELQLMRRKCEKNINETEIKVTIDRRAGNLLIRLRDLATLVVHQPRKVTCETRINVALKQDRRVCTIAGLCLLKDGTILLTDHNNKKLKRFCLATNQLMDSVFTKQRPWAICAVGAEKAVVTHEEGALIFFDIRQKMTEIRTVPVTHACVGISHSLGKLYVTDRQKTLHIYDLHGNPIRRFRSDQLGFDLFSSIKRVTVSSTGDKIYVADDTRGLITLDRQGNVLSILNEESFRNPVALCPDGDGGVFVCGKQSGNIVQIGLRGNVLGTVVASAECPHSLAFDSETLRLYVTLNKCNDMIVYDLM